MGRRVTKSVKYRTANIGERNSGTIVAAAKSGVSLLLRALGEDSSREGLVDTPERMVRAYREMTEGYTQDPVKLLKTFSADGYDEVVTVGPVDFYSLCEHHMLPFYGQAWLAYLPDKRIIGLSKLPRLVQIYARRLQVQERLTVQIATTLEDLLQPRGVAVAVKAKHLCCGARGIRQQNTEMRTTVLRGVFRKDHKSRAEFLEAVR